MPDPMIALRYSPTNLLRWEPEQERPLEFREAPEGDESPGIIEGPVVIYGDRAKFGDWTETFAAGAFGDTRRLDVTANMQHQRAAPIARTGGRGGLVLTDSPEMLRATLTLPPTTLGRDVAVLARRRVLRGYSMEFYPEKYLEDADAKTVQVLRARMPRIGVVDTPAYPRSRIKARAEDSASESRLEALLEELLAELRQHRQAPAPAQHYWNFGPNPAAPPQSPPEGGQRQEQSEDAPSHPAPEDSAVPPAPELPPKRRWLISRFMQ